MFRKLKEFHERTMAIYNRDIEESMEPWKKKVLLLHEKAEYLFYVEDIGIEKEKGICTIRGEIVRGSREIGDTLELLNGEGSLMGRAILKSLMAEKEETRRGIHRKRNEFKVEVISLKGQSVSDLDDAEYRRLIRSLAMQLSLITDIKTLEQLF